MLLDISTEIHPEMSNETLPTIPPDGSARALAGISTENLPEFSLEILSGLFLRIPAEFLKLLQ